MFKFRLRLKLRLKFLRQPSVRLLFRLKERLILFPTEVFSLDLDLPLSSAILFQVENSLLLFKQSRVELWF